MTNSKPTKANNEWSKNDRAEKICGKRKIAKNTIIFDQPCELDYHCPVCKYKNVVNGNYDERLEWSEYNYFIWCRVCNKDYPSILCMPIDKAIDAYLGILHQQREEVRKEGYEVGYAQANTESGLSKPIFEEIRKTAKEETIEDIISMVKKNLSGKDCWYIEDLVKLLQSLKVKNDQSK